jgi:hypothetical protein
MANVKGNPGNNFPRSREVDLRTGGKDRPLNYRRILDCQEGLFQTATGKATRKLNTSVKADDPWSSFDLALLSTVFEYKVLLRNALI